jgi:methylated-DNA-[protein]-cysteine S-methyltransferase
MRHLLEKVAAAAVRENLYDAAFGEIDTPIGPLVIVQSPRGLCRVSFGERDTDDVLAEVADGIGPRIVRSDDAIEPARAALRRYFQTGKAASVPVDLRLAPKGVLGEMLARLRRVPSGRVVTYGELARRSGHPRAARAAGTACAQNPVPIIVPCHRVVPSSGGVGNYGGGAEIKRFLLELEGAL